MEKLKKANIAVCFFAFKLELFHFSQVEEGIRFLGDSYAAVETGQAQMTSLEFKFKTLSPSGVLVYSGEVTILCSEYEYKIEYHISHSRTDSLLFNWSATGRSEGSGNETGLNSKVVY